MSTKRFEAEAQDEKSRRQFLKYSAAALGAVALSSYAAWKFSLHHLEVVDVQLPIDRLPVSLDGARLVQLSDLHIGPEVDDNYVLRAFRMANELKPDILAFTGDFVSWRGPQQLQQLERAMQEMPKARIASVAILGNHDYGHRWREPAVAEDIVKTVSNHGVRFMRNSAISIEGLNLIGVDDLWSGMTNVETARLRSREIAPGGAPELVLCHNPDVADQRVWEGYRGWMLSGHTHGGQCKPPFMAPPLLPIQNKAYAAGEVKTRDGRTVYINRGVGHTLPIRVNVRPEITSYRLVRA